MGRIRNRKDLRADFDAAERRGKEDEEREEDDDEEGDEDEEEEGEEGEAVDDSEEDDDAGDDSADDDEDGPKKKKKVKAKVKVKAVPVVKPKSRSRAAKIVRMRQIWGVFDNSQRMVATYPYAKRDDAEAHASKLIADKKSTHFVQPVREVIEEPKEPEKAKKEK